MIMEIDLETNGDETSVTFTFKNIPNGISLADNESGTIHPLKNLLNMHHKRKFKLEQSKKNVQLW